MGLSILGCDILNEWYLSVSGVPGSFTEMLLLLLVATTTFCTVLYLAGMLWILLFICWLVYDLELLNSIFFFVLFHGNRLDWESQVYDCI